MKLKRPKNLIITEVASCHKGMNPEAKVVFAKADQTQSVFDNPVVKGVFEDVLVRNKVSSVFWDLKYALEDSISLVWNDNSLTMEQKVKKIGEIAEEYVTAVSSLLSLAKSANGGDTKIETPVKETIIMADEKSFTQAEMDQAVQKAKEESLISLNKANAIIALDSKERGYFEGLEGGKKDGFLSLSKGDRVKEMERATSLDESFTTSDGSIVRKSVVGEQLFCVLKAQQEQIEKSRKEAEVEKAKRLESEAIRKAEDQFPNIPGDPVTKGKWLQAVEGIADAGVKDALLSVLKAADNSFQHMYNPVGNGGLTLLKGRADAAKQLDEKVAAYSVEHKISKADAYGAILGTPEGQELAKLANDK